MPVKVNQTFDVQTHQCAGMKRTRGGDEVGNEVGEVVPRGADGWWKGKLIIDGVQQLPQIPRALHGGGPEEKNPEAGDFYWDTEWYENDVRATFAPEDQEAVEERKVEERKVEEPSTPQPVPRARAVVWTV